MPNLVKAQFDQLQSDFKTLKPGTTVVVQFNPESLKVSFANQLQQPQGAGDQRGPATMQFVGSGTTKMTAQLWFDAATAAANGLPAVDDVRQLTKKVADLITPQENPQSGQGQGGFIPPFVSFSWGTFRFDGIMESLEENLEFFSPDGKPLRASVTFTLTQQKIQFLFGESRSPRAPGNKPLAAAPQGSTLQSMASSAGLGADWQSIAEANGIENPRMLATGQLIDLSAGVSGGASAGVSAGVSLGVGGTGGAVSGGASGGVSVGFNVG